MTAAQGRWVFPAILLLGLPKSVADPALCDYGRVLNVRNKIAMRWSFNLDTGFEGTAQETKQYYVMVYYPGR